MINETRLGFGSSFAFVIAAAGAAVGLGVGAMLVYGQYLPVPPHGVPVSRVVFAVAMVDTLVAICAGLMIFAIIFSQGGDASSGPGLLFVALPVAFGEMVGGYFFGVLWFTLIIVAALTSSISFLEVCTAHFESRGYTRIKVAISIGVGITVLGFGSVWAFGAGSDVEILAGKNFFDTLDFLTSNIALPIGGLMTLVVAPWAESRAEYRKFLPELSEGTFVLLYSVTKFVSPILVIAVLIYMLVTGLQ